MALTKSLYYSKYSILFTINGYRGIQTSAVRAIDMKWREERGLARNPNTHGPLTNLPDYTFMDGRPTPLGSNQKQRIIRQRELAHRIVALTTEIDNGKKRYQFLQQENQRTKQNIIANKFKQKGHLLLKK